MRKNKTKDLTNLYYKKPAKLHFKYSAMNGGKSTALIQIAYNYRQTNNQPILVTKPAVDTKGGEYVVSRIGEDVRLKCDFLIDGQSSIVDIVNDFMIKYNSESGSTISAILVDEAQFLNKKDVEELAYIASLIGIPVICFGLRTDFQGNIFEGSSYLFAYAHDIEELTTRPLSALGDKTKKATMNLRLVNGKPSFSGEQVIIDNIDEVEYKPVSLRHFLHERNRVKDLEPFGRKVDMENIFFKESAVYELDEWIRDEEGYSFSLVALYKNGAKVPLGAVSSLKNYLADNYKKFRKNGLIKELSVEKKPIEPYKSTSGWDILVESTYALGEYYHRIGNEEER